MQKIENEKGGEEPAEEEGHNVAEEGKIGKDQEACCAGAKRGNIGDGKNKDRNEKERKEEEIKDEGEESKQNRTETVV